MTTAKTQSPFSHRFFYVRTIIFLTLFAVTFLHLISSIPALILYNKDFQLAQKVFYLNEVSDDLFDAVENYGFERGRVNVVLNDAGPVEGMTENRKFILKRRPEGDESLKAALAKLEAKGMDSIKPFIDAIKKHSRKIANLRQETAEDMLIPIGKRRQELAEIWFAEMTQYIESIKSLLFSISNDISDADGMISRYSSIKHETLALRNTAGPEVSILVATIFSEKPMIPQLTNKIAKLQISTRHHFQNLAHLIQPLADSRIPDALAALKKSYFDEYYPIRNTVYPLALKGGPYPYSQKEFLDHGVKALRQIGSFMDTVVAVTQDYAETQVSKAEKEITIHLTSSIGSLIIIILIFLFVNNRIIMPISLVTSSVRRLANKDLDIEVPFQENQDEIGEMARAVEVFKGMAIQLEEDMTALRIAEEKIKDSEERFRTVSDFAYDWEYWVDPYGDLEYISPSCKRVTGYSSEEFKDNPCLIREICIQEDNDILTEHFNKENLKDDPAMSIDFRIRMKTGEIRWINHICQAIVNEDGTFLGRRACNRDITDRKQLEEDLIKAKKLEATATLAGGIAHDFNNLLTVILGNIELAEDVKADHDDSHIFLEQARLSAIRARNLTAKFITFSSGGTPVKKQAEINSVIINSTALVLSGTNIRLETRMPSESWLVEFDQNQINQVISNIVTNAKEAMPNGGSLNLTIENLKSISDIKNIKYLNSNEKYVKVTFQDEGMGISNRIVKKVFDPYFTTKEMGSNKGMGLGLTIAHSIILKHSGNITIDANEGEGTAVSFYLPAQTRPAHPKIEQDDYICEAAIPEGRKKILIMDDEDLVRNVVTNMLEHYQMITDSAIDGAEAVGKYKNAIEAGCPFDIVIVDLTVPGGMGGVETVKELLKIDSKAKVIVASGYASDPVMDNFQDHGFRAAISKPFQIKDLLDIIRKLSASSS